MNFTLLALALFFFLWLVLDLEREKMIERYRFRPNVKVSYSRVVARIIDRLTTVEDVYKAEMFVSFCQGIGIFAGLLFSALVWVLYPAFNALIVTLLVLVLAAILPKIALRYLRSSIERSYDREIPLTAFLLTIRVRADESVKHILRDVCDALPGDNRQNRIRPLLETGIFSLKEKDSFKMSVKLVKELAPFDSVSKLIKAILKWYSEPERGKDSLEIFYVEQEAVFQLKESFNSRMYVALGSVIVLFVLLGTGAGLLMLS